MTEFNTVHVFGFGKAQIISQSVNKQVDATKLTTLAAFVGYIKSLKPAEITLTDYHVIHIFNNLDVKYLGKKADGSPAETKTAFVVKWADLNLTTVTALVDEIAAAAAV